MFAFGEETVELEINGPGNYIVGENISGDIILKQGDSVIPFANITYRFTNEDGSKLYNIGQLRTDKNGEVSFDIAYPDHVQSGKVTIKFAYGDNWFVHHYLIEEEAMSLHFDKHFYNPGDDISIKGRIKTTDTSLSFKVKDVHGSIIKTFDVPVNSFNFNYKFTMPETLGSYQLLVSVGEQHLGYDFLISESLKYIHRATEVITSYGVRATMPTTVTVDLLDGTTTELPVIWDLSQFDFSQVGTRYVMGIVDGGYSTLIHVKVRPFVPNYSDDDDDKKPEPPKKTDTIDDVIPKAGADATDKEKKAVHDKAQTLIKDMKKSKASAKDIKSLNKSLNKTLNILSPEDAMALTNDMVDLVGTSMNSITTNEATDLVKDVINESYKSILENEALTLKEQKKIEKTMTKLVKELISTKASITTKDGMIDVKNIDQAVKDVAALQTSLNQTLQSSNLKVTPTVTIDLETQNALKLNKDVLNSLAESEMDLTLKAKGVSFSLPTDLISKLGTDVTIESHDASAASLSKKTSNGQVKNLKTMDLTVATEGKSVNQSVTLSMPLDDLTVDFDALMVGVYEAGEWVKLDYEIIDNQVVFTAPHFSIYSLMTYQPSFKDIDANWAKKYITSLAAKGIVSGKATTTFDPNGTITRAEFVTMLINHMKLDDKAVVNFSDAKGWFTDYLSIAKANGLYYGNDGNSFRPMDAITREEMAMMIQQAYTLKTGHALEGKSTPFSDHSTISSDASDAVYAMKTNDIISGYPDNTFKPAHTATRAEAATMLYKLLEQ